MKNRHKHLLVGIVTLLILGISTTSTNENGGSRTVLKNPRGKPLLIGVARVSPAAVEEKIVGSAGG